MNQDTFRSLNALMSLARFDLGEAVLELANKLEAQSGAKDEVSEHEQQLATLREVHDRAAQPGAWVNVAAMGVLARQALVTTAALKDAQATKRQCDDFVDTQRQGVLHLQRRADGLLDALQATKKALAHERDNKLARDNEDLFLTRRMCMKARS